jgi:hypothetical protein
MGTSQRGTKQETPPPEKDYHGASLHRAMARCLAGPYIVTEERQQNSIASWTGIKKIIFMAHFKKSHCERGKNHG